MARRPVKQPQARILPTSGKQPRTAARGDPTLHDRETIVWAFRTADLEGPWGWRSAAAKVWWTEILPKLRYFWSMTWAEIMLAAGGRAKGNNSHFVEIRNLTKHAKDRLKKKCAERRVGSVFTAVEFDRAHLRNPRPEGLEALMVRPASRE